MGRREEGGAGVRQWERRKRRDEREEEEGREGRQEL